MLDAERPDIVVVCGRYDFNAPLALEAIRPAATSSAKSPPGKLSPRSPPCGRR
jgi:hypothetical protein